MFDFGAHALMRFLAFFYQKVLLWSRHPKAVYYLAWVSFVDSSVFPVSPAFMFVPMAFAKPSCAFWYAWVCTLSSVLGGIVGYLLGYFAFEMLLEPFVQWMGYTMFYEQALRWFQDWGFWAIFVAGLSPIPYKIFTISAGVLQLNFPGFILASFLGRMLRFFLMAAALRWGGPKVEPILRRMVQVKMSDTPP